MTRVERLCAMNRMVMESFSQRTVNGLKAHTLFRLALPPFQSFLDINVGKEVEKDRRVITLAAELLQIGATPGPAHVSALLQEARQIDQDFLRRAAVFPIDIRIRYQDIEHYRQRRIELLLHTSYPILKQWQTSSSFRAAVQALYDAVQFQTRLHEILSLYARETHMLSRSIRIPHLLSLAREAITQTVTTVMEQEAETLAREVTRTVYRRGK